MCIDILLLPPFFFSSFALLASTQLVGSNNTLKSMNIKTFEFIFFYLNST